MTEEIIVIGAGGFGREALDVIQAINSAAENQRWRVVGVVDDTPTVLQLSRLKDRGIAYLGVSATVLTRMEPISYVIGIGSPSVRSRLARSFDAAGWMSATLVHPTAVVGSRVAIAPGGIVCGGVQLSTNTDLGRHVHLNPGSIVGHDAVLGDFVSVNPGAIVSGEVVIEQAVLIGAGAVVLQGIQVGSAAVIGASACVTRDVEDRTIVAGVPARKIRDVFLDERVVPK